jgi:L-threonylcarbamoyladenylate synthase
LYSASSYNPDQIKEGISVLCKGGIIAFPTDTVYGLGASSRIIKAVERIFRVKERSYDMALPLLLTDESQIEDAASSVPPVARNLIRSFLPGALTLVLYKSELIPDIIPDHPVPRALAAGLGTPIVGTSANISGQPSPTTAEEVRLQLGNRIDLIIDGGRCPGGQESTVVDVTGPTPVLLRQGAIPREAIEKVCGRILTAE